MDADDVDVDDYDDDHDGRPFTWKRFLAALAVAGLVAILTHYLFGVP